MIEPDDEGGSTENVPAEVLVEKAPLSRSALESIVSLKPAYRHSLVGGTLAASTAGHENMEWAHVLDAYNAQAEKTRDGDLSAASNMLTAQALTLDTLFTEMLSRATKNMGHYPEAMERYMRLALKAQAQSRATLEALVKMHQPREQTVRHIHVGPNGQAVFIENLHGGMGNVRSAEQAHAQSAPSPALLRHDASGHGVPITGSERPAEMSHARRSRRKRRPGGKQ